MTTRGPARPAEVFDREQEWGNLARFATAPGRGLQIGIVRGRRRLGKSFLLRRLVAAAGGFYHQALQEEPAQALARLGADLGAHLHVPGGRLALRDWSEAMGALVGLASKRSTPVVVVLDELPYLLDHSPQLASIVQLAYDETRTRSDPPVRLVLCGSALSTMSRLLAGQQPLRGRATLDLVVNTFDFRDSARFWGIGDPALAFHVNAVVGGTPGYRDLLPGPPPSSMRRFTDWLLAGPLDPASALFREADYLLDSERALTDRALYHSVLTAIAGGKTTQSAISAELGREQRAVQHPLRVLEETGFVVRDDDVLRQRRPVYRLADPIVRFAHAVIRPDLARFEERLGAEAWVAAADRFRSQVLGPHFEDLARSFTLRHASASTLGGRPARVGAAVVNDAAGRAQHQVDVVATARGSGEKTRVLLLGEAKYTNTARTLADLRRLEHVRALLARRDGLDADHAGLAVFAAGGFDRHLRAAAENRTDVVLVDLDRLYTGE